MDYPLELRTERAMGILGRLIFDWAEKPTPLTPGFREETGRIVIDVETFHQLMQDEGLMRGDPGSKGGDYAVRVNVRELELFFRSPDRASILLPEMQVVKAYRGMTAPIDVPVVRLYKEVAEDYSTGGPAQLNKALESMESVIDGKVRLESDPLESFIYPNTAYYSCTQCL